MTQLLAMLEISSILCLVTVAAMMTFRLAGFPDLSVDGVFTLGAVVLAMGHVSEIAWPYCIALSILAGALAGFVTSTMSERLRINPLLASVLMLTMLYTVNLRVLGRATQPLFELSVRFGDSIVFLGALSLIILVIIYFFYMTEFGCALRSTGTSAAFLTSVGRNAAAYRIAIVVAANCLVSLAGALMAARYGFADVSMGVGVVIIGIAAIIIGERLVGRHPFGRQIVAAPIGILIYQLAVGIALSLGLEPTDVKLATGVLAIALLASQRVKGEDLLASAERHP